MRRKVFDLTKNDLTKDTEGISMQDLITAYDKFLFGDHTKFIEPDEVSLQWLRSNVIQLRGQPIDTFNNATANRFI